MIIFLGNDKTTKLFKNIINTTKADKPDIVVSCQYSFLIPESLIQSHTCVNIHFGKLPEYAGCNPIFWQIIKNEEKAGVTLHYVDKTFDSGDIIDIEYVDIGYKIAEDVYNDCLYAAVELLTANYFNILNDTTTRIKQDLSKRCYYPKTAVDFTKKLDINSSNITREWQAYCFPSKQVPIIGDNL